MNRYIINKKGKRIKEKPKAEKIFIAMIIILVVFMASYSRYNLEKKIDTYNKRAEALNEQIKLETDRAQDIADYGKYTKTKKFVEEVAKEKLGLVNENEIVFKTEN